MSDEPKTESPRLTIRVEGRKATATLETSVENIGEVLLTLVEEIADTPDETFDSWVEKIREFMHKRKAARSDATDPSEVNS